jgi:hypothetical protein
MSAEVITTTETGVNDKIIRMSEFSIRRRMNLPTRLLTTVSRAASGYTRTLKFAEPHGVMVGRYIILPHRTYTGVGANYSSPTDAGSTLWLVQSVPDPYTLTYSHPYSVTESETPAAFPILPWFYRLRIGLRFAIPRTADWTDNHLFRLCLGWSVDARDNPFTSGTCVHFMGMAFHRPGLAYNANGGKPYLSWPVGGGMSLCSKMGGAYDTSRETPLGSTVTNGGADNVLSAARATPGLMLLDMQVYQKTPPRGDDPFNYLCYREVHNGYNRLPVTSDQFKVREQGLAATVADGPELHVWFTKSGQASIAAKVEAVEDNGDGTETVTLATAAGAFDASWQAWVLQYVRLADDTERGTFNAEQRLVRNVSVVELPHEYAQIETGSRPIYFYHFFTDQGGSQVDWRLTSFACDFTSIDGAWTAARITHQQLSHNTRGDRPEVLVDAEFTPANPLFQLCPSALAMPLNLTIQAKIRPTAGASPAATGRSQAFSQLRHQRAGRGLVPGDREDLAGARASLRHPALERGSGCLNARKGRQD